METKRRSGNLCAVRRCNNSNKRTKISFFKFPKDSIRAKKWAELCEREDLADKDTKILHKNHIVCGTHFEQRMFVNDLRNRLQPNAEPTVFPSLEGPFRTDHTYSAFVPQFSSKESISSNQNSDSLSNDESPIKKPINILENILLKEKPIMDTQPHTPSLSHVPVQHEIPVNISLSPAESTKQLTPPVSSSFGVQTPNSLISKMPIITNLRSKINTLKVENYRLRRRLQDQKNSESDLEQITFEQYKNLTYKFCKSKEVAEFIIVQLNQIGKSPRNRKFRIG